MQTLKVVFKRRLIRRLKNGRIVYYFRIVVGFPEQAKKLLPEWIGIVASLEELPEKCIALVDEAYIVYSSRGSMTSSSRVMSQALNLSR